MPETIPEPTPYDRIAGNIHALIDQEAALPMPEWMNDPNISVFALLHDRRQAATRLSHVAGSNAVTEVPLFADEESPSTPMDTYTRLLAYSAIIAESSCRPGADNAILDQRFVEYMQKKVLSSKSTASPSEQFDAIGLLSIIAVENKPDGPINIDNVVSGKPKKESHREKAFRLAMVALDQFVDKKYPEGQEAWLDAPGLSSKKLSEIKEIDPRYARSLEDYTATDALKSHAAFMQQIVINEALPSSAITAQIYAWQKQQEKEEYIAYMAAEPALATVADVHDVPVKHLDWMMLSPDEGTKPPHRPEDPSVDEEDANNETSTGTSAAGEAAKGEQSDAIDEASLRRLAAIAIAWGNDAEIGISKLHSRSKYPYYVAVLPETLDDGVVVHHAVAEHPADGRNAAFVFRGERGVDHKDGENKVWLTWKDVFDEESTKTSARLLGARKVTHGPNFDANLMEYLTRHPDELDRPGYKR